jgi:KEOPS complex subunit Pcc1
MEYNLTNSYIIIYYNDLKMFRVKLTLEKSEYMKYLEAIKPEVTETFGRSKVELAEDALNIYIIIEAPDTSSLRASVSSITRVLNVTKKIMEVDVW